MPRLFPTPELLNRIMSFWIFYFILFHVCFPFVILTITLRVLPNYQILLSHKKRGFIIHVSRLEFYRIIFVIKINNQHAAKLAPNTLDQSSPPSPFSFHGLSLNVTATAVVKRWQCYHHQYVSRSYVFTSIYLPLFST